MSRRTFSLLTGLVLSLVLPGPAAAQSGKLAPIDGDVKKYVESILNLRESAEARGRRIAVTAVDDAKSQSYAGKTGARQHPWKNDRDMGTSWLDYYIDSYLMIRHDQEGLNTQNYRQVYGCHEAGLLAYSYDSSDGKMEQNPDLGQECRQHCPNQFEDLGRTCQTNPTIGPLYNLWITKRDPEAKRALEAITKENGYELVEYWFPEYQVSLNNYGISRLNPVPFGGSGPSFSRNALIGQKQSADMKTVQAFSQQYPMTASPPRIPAEFFGNGEWGGFAVPDTEAKSYAKIYRVWQTWQFSNNKVLSQPKTDGWQTPAINALYTFTDGFPPMTVEHEITNIWMEWDVWDMATSVPHFSSMLSEGQAIMGELAGGMQQIKQAAAQNPPFWQTQGAMAYRAAAWPDLYGNLQQVLRVSPNKSSTLEPVVYKNNYELWPLVTNASDFTSPLLGTQVLFARRALELAGLKDMEAHYPPTGGPIKKIMRYTIDQEKPSREIDKMQLIYPRKRKGAQFPARSSEGYFDEISECFRSQKIPSMLDQNNDEWTKRNFPADLQGYVMDNQIMGAEGKDVSVAYWNHRIDCSCDICGRMPGATKNLNMGGDLPKERRRIAECKFMFGTTYSAFIGAGEDMKAYCNRPGDPASFEAEFKGQDDKV